MERRDILKASAMLLGYAAVGGTAAAVLNGCKADTSDGFQPKLMKPEQLDLLAEISERILPKTETPGAKDALVHRFIDEAVASNYDAKEKEDFFGGLKQFDEVAQASFQKEFISLSDEEKDKVLQEMAEREKDDNFEGVKAFEKMRELTVYGFCTSEVGATQALVHLPVPGPYQGCIPLSDVNGVYAY